MKSVFGFDDLDFMFLKHMTDFSMVNFCQTSKDALKLTENEHIKNRIKHFYNCLDYQIDDLRSVMIEHDITNPLYLFTSTWNDESIIVYTMDDDEYKMIYISHTLPDHPVTAHQTLDIDYCNDFDSNYIKNVDILSLYNIYRKIGFDHDIAKYKIIKEIKEKHVEMYDKMEKLKHTVYYLYFLYFNLQKLLVWFKISCIALKLCEDKIEAYNKSISESYLKNEYKESEVIEEINYYYELLIQFVNQL
jgi:hypothetical protein